MSLRKTSCTACVSAKRRCDRGLPACDRCLRKGSPCTYPYRHGTIRQDVPQERDLLPPNTPEFIQTSPSDVSSPGIMDFNELPDFDFSYIDALAASILSGQTEDPSIIYSTDPLSLMDMPGGASTVADSPVPSSELCAHQGGSSDTRKRTEAQSQRPGYLPRRRRVRYSQGRQQTTTSFQRPAGISWPLSTSDIWPRGRDTETWQFCGKEFISFVHSFATTATNTFISRGISEFGNIGQARLNHPLQRALGVCAAFKTINEANQHIFYQFLEMELQGLIESPGSWVSLSSHSNNSSMNKLMYDESLLAFRYDLSRLQAMLLYQIVGFFGPSLKHQRLARTYEPLMGAWTRELLLRIQVLRLRSEGVELPSISSPASSYHPASGNSEDLLMHPFTGLNTSLITHHAREDTLLQKDEMETAYRTILLSVLARATFSALKEETCMLLPELSALPVLVPFGESDYHDPTNTSHQVMWGDLRHHAERHRCFNSKDRTLPYNEFADLWGQQKSKLELGDRDPFIVLLLVACKGVGILRS